MALFKKKPSPKKETVSSAQENTADQTSEKNKTPKLKVISSTQMWSPIKDIMDGIIITKDGKFVMLMELSPINFDLLGPKEQDYIANAFGAALHSFPINLQIKVLSRKASVDSHINEILSCMEKEESTQCRTMQQHTIHHIKTEAKDSVSRRFILAFQYHNENTILHNFSWEDIRSDLYMAAYQIAGSLSAPPCNVGVLTEIGDNMQAEELLYSCICRKASEEIPFDVRHEAVCNRAQALNTDERNQYMDINNLLAPQIIDPYNYSYVEVDGACYMYGTINQRSYPSTRHSGWLSNLINQSEGVDFDIFIERLNPRDISMKLTYATQFTQVDLANSNMAAADHYHLQSKLQSEQYIQQGREHRQDLLNFAILMTVTGKDRVAVKKKFQFVRNEITRQGLELNPCNGKHDLAFRSAIPLANPDPTVLRNAKRNILNCDFGSAFPFVSYEVNDDGGIRIGHNKQNGSDIFLNLFNRKLYSNGNFVLFGSTGAGKSYTLQLMALRLRQQLTHTIAITPYKGEEYRRPCHAIGGSFISIAPGSVDNINVMEIRKYEASASDEFLNAGMEKGENSILMEKIAQLHIFFSLIRPNMTENEKSVLDEALLQTYAKRGITVRNKSLLDPSDPSRYKEMPILEDLDNELATKKGSGGIRESLKRFIKGSARNFNGKTNVNLDNPYVVIDVSSMSKELMPIAIFIATDFVYDTIRSNRETRKAVFIDELSRMVGLAGSKYAAEFVLTLQKTVRAYNTILVLATQDTNDFFALEGGWYGRGILANAKLTLIMKQTEAEMETLTKNMRLSDNESYRPVHFASGDGLLIANRNHVEIKVQASRLEHTLLTTDPEELKQLSKQYGSVENLMEEFAKINKIKEVPYRNESA